MDDGRHLAELQPPSACLDRSDRRRLRPNILVGDVAGLDERTWEGRALRAGSAIIGVDSLRARCVMTIFDPDTLAQDNTVLERIVREFDGRLALNCHVIQPGTIAIGDSVELIDTARAT